MKHAEILEAQKIFEKPAKALVQHTREASQWLIYGTEWRKETDAKNTAQATEPEFDALEKKAMTEYTSHN